MPLFVVPTAEANALQYADFARVLGTDQPVHMLQPVGFDGRRPLDQIEAIAEYFVGEIRKLQPRGPYRLAGFCVGGIVAFEMAQQLITSGEEPPLLALQGLGFAVLGMVAWRRRHPKSQVRHF